MKKILIMIILIFGLSLNNAYSNDFDEFIYASEDFIQQLSTINGKILNCKTIEDAQYVYNRLKIESEVYQVCFKIMISNIDDDESKNEIEILFHSAKKEYRKILKHYEEQLWPNLLNF